MSAGFACPSCRGALVDLSCESCGRRYETVDGIPVLLGGESQLSAQQAAFFDDTGDSEFEIERPHGSPSLYGWLLGEKFRLAVTGVPVRGRTALVVCGGSGMDAEFLARAGADVISSDISLGAAKRTLERCRRQGLSVAAVVANAERLPFADRSVDVVYVHDGLHHLARPLVGLAEMARVARLAVCVTEPARAAATALAVRLGVAQDVEEAGNRVARLTLAEVREVLERHEFRVVRARRYAMFYRHEPRVAMRLLSRPPLLALATRGLRLVNLLMGRVGNKLTVQGVRG